jgi:hypothetical protein
VIHIILLKHIITAYMKFKFKKFVFNELSITYLNTRTTFFFKFSYFTTTFPYYFPNIS